MVLIIRQHIVIVIPSTCYWIKPKDIIFLFFPCCCFFQMPAEFTHSYLYSLLAMCFPFTLRFLQGFYHLRPHVSKSAVTLRIARWNTLCIFSVLCTSLCVHACYMNVSVWLYACVHWIFTLLGRQNLTFDHKQTHCMLAGLLTLRILSRLAPEISYKYSSCTLMCWIYNSCFSVPDQTWDTGAAAVAPPFHPG